MYSKDRILTVAVPEEKGHLIERFLDVDTIKKMEAKKKCEVLSHA